MHIANLWNDIPLSAAQQLVAGHSFQRYDGLLAANNGRLTRNKAQSEFSGIMVSKLLIVPTPHV
jgi:hypothetical protein